jgi:hypothetical protein
MFTSGLNGGEIYVARYSRNSHFLAETPVVLPWSRFTPPTARRHQKVFVCLNHQQVFSTLM